MNFEPTQVNTTEENASDFISKVNELLAQNSVVDKLGNPAILKAYAGSPTWLFALAQGQISTEWQERLRKAFYSIDIEKCDEDQVYVLATLAGVLFREQSSPMIPLTITNPSETDAIVINSSSCYAEDSFGNNKWYPGIAYTIAAQETVRLLFYCEDKSGSTPPNTTFTLKSNDALFEDITIVSTESSQILFQGETSADLRNRILNGNSYIDQITQAQNAIANLNGIVKCSIYFNPDANVSKVLPGNITVPPRSSFISIQGVDIDSLLATTYFKYVNVQSVNIPNVSLRSEALVGASQLFVYYSAATEIHPKIKIYLDPTDSAVNTYPDYIKNIVMQHKDEIAIGATITAQKVSAWIDSGNKYGVLIDVKLSADGTTWSDSFTPNADEVPILQEQDITFEEITL